MTTVAKKNGVPSITRSFRLIDFHIYDETPPQDDIESGSDEDAEQYKYSPPKKDENRFVIQIFGINEKGETCCLYVNDYEPFFYVRVGDNWTKTKMNAFIQNLQ